MKLSLQLRFHTYYGQSLWVAGNHEMLGAGRPEKVLPLSYLDDQAWQVTLEIDPEAVPAEGVSYHYVLKNPDGSLVEDWDPAHRVERSWLEKSEVLIVDSWCPAGAVENAFYTEPFQRVLLSANRGGVQVPTPAPLTHVFRVKAPLLEPGQTLCILGDCKALGNWATALPRLMSKAEGDACFRAEVNLAGSNFPVAYKYGVYNVETGAFVRYESGENRTLRDREADGRLTVVNDGFAALPANNWKGAGVAIPVFSLRTEKSFGVGEFADLKPMSDWCKRAGLKLIQVLPINDTIATHTWLDSYPYAAISAFALHPLYLNLERMAGEQHRDLLQEVEEERQRLNSLDAVDYPGVMKAKQSFIKLIYPLEKAATFKRRDYRKFFERNRHWLEPYAVFCCLRDETGTADFTQWPAYRKYDPREAAALAAPDAPGYDAIAIHYFTQFHLHLQLREAVEYAHRNGVILKGDIPIGVYRHGADAWQDPDLYHMEVQAGAPPDAFAAKGQNWGFPTYNWPRMKQDGYAWWRRRFEQMGHYFDAFRIDHILGFFRIWSIPVDAVEGILGYFVPAIPVHVDEFRGRGIQFDYGRLALPYITDEVLSEIFGPGAERVKTGYLNLVRTGFYALKPEFDTQRKVERHFAAREESAESQRLKQGLYDLISNVIVFEVAGSGGKQFHFRFGIDQTRSFQRLDDGTRGKLWDLYIDYFYRRQDAFWMKEAMEKLPALKRATNMLVCGEDLGMVPGCVPEVMRQLGLLSLEIQRMPKDPRQEFFRPKDAPYLSVVTPSTHDMSTVRGWWKEDLALTRKFYNQELGQAGEPPAECTPEIASAILVQHLVSPAMWSIFQWQDIMAITDKLRRRSVDEERINIPANPRNRWCYRMHLPIEVLMQFTDFADELRVRIQDCGR